MRDDFLKERIRAAIESMDDETPEHWFAKMERLGILDAEGNVLRRMPEPPEETHANGRRKRSRGKGSPPQSPKKGE